MKEIIQIIQAIWENGIKSDIQIGILVLGICMFCGSALKSVNDPSIKETLRNPKDKEKYTAIRSSVIIVIFTIMNVSLGNDKNNIDKLKVIAFIVFCASIYFYRKSSSMKKYIEEIDGIEKLSDIYFERHTLFMLMGIFSITPIITYVMHEKLQQYHFSIISCGIMASAAILSIIVLCDFNKLKRVSTNYILYNNRKIYIYERLDENTILCGNHPKKNKANKYIYISYEDIKTTEIKHESYEIKDIPRNRKKELKRIYRNKKWNNCFIRQRIQDLIEWIRSE